MKNYKIAVAGTGYVGLSLSVLLAQHNQVTAVDIVQAKVDMINNHRSPINEKLVRENRTMKNYKIAVAGTGECEIIWATKNNPDFMRVCAA